MFKLNLKLLLVLSFSNTSNIVAAGDLSKKLLTQLNSKDQRVMLMIAEPMIPETAAIEWMTIEDVMIPETAANECIDGSDEPQSLERETLEEERLALMKKEKHRLVVKKRRIYSCLFLVIILVLLTVCVGRTSNMPKISLSSLSKHMQKISLSSLSELYCIDNCRKYEESQRKYEESLEKVLATYKASEKQCRENEERLNKKSLEDDYRIISLQDESMEALKRKKKLIESLNRCEAKQEAKVVPAQWLITAWQVYRTRPMRYNKSRAQLQEEGWIVILPTSLNLVLDDVWAIIPVLRQAIVWAAYLTFTLESALRRFVIKFLGYYCCVRAFEHYLSLDNPEWFRPEVRTQMNFILVWLTYITAFRDLVTFFVNIL